MSGTEIPVRFEAIMSMDRSEDQDLKSFKEQSHAPYEEDLAYE